MLSNCVKQARRMVAGDVLFCFCLLLETRDLNKLKSKLDYLYFLTFLHALNPLCACLHMEHSIYTPPPRCNVI